MTPWKAVLVGTLTLLAGLLLATAAGAQETEDRLQKASEGLQMPGSEADNAWWCVSYPGEDELPSVGRFSEIVGCDHPEGGVSRGDFDATLDSLGEVIGTDPSGTIARGNNFGVLLNSPNPTVGGTSPAARNLISGNLSNGVGIGDPGRGSTVQGNLIGTMKDGTLPLGNGYHGVVMHGFGSSLGTVANNTIAFNGGTGVIVASGSTGISILSNRIYSNGELGIDLKPPSLDDGPTANDAGDADTGTNNLQNFPVTTRATTSRSTGRSVVRGTLNSAPITTFTVQLFVNSAQDPSGFGEGQRLLRTLSVRTDASGNASFSMKARKLRGFISATATNDATGDTSEFSKAKKVVRTR